MSKVLKPNIYFHYITKPFHFTGRTALKAFISDLLKQEGKQIDSINYIFCTDEYLLDLNKKHLGHNTLTDIITFEYSGKGMPVLSDIYISIDRVKENALLFNTSFQRELLRVVFHGALHLSGFKDKSPEQSRLMRKKEEEYLLKWDVSRGTA